MKGKISCILFILLLHCIPSFAAFPVMPQAVNTTSNSGNNYPVQTTANTLAILEEAITPVKPKARVRNYSTTLGLCIVFGLLGIHRLYLGYYWQGFLQMLITLGFTAAILALTPALALGLALLIVTLLPMIGLLFWVVIDFLRILQKNLVPRGGYYN